MTVRGLSRRVVLVVSVCGAVLAPVRAGADGAAGVDEQGSARLYYVLGEGTQRCPGEAQVRDAVAAKLGYSPWDSKAPRMILVTIGRAAGSGRDGLKARVELRDVRGGSGQRELRAGDCAALTASVVLAIAIAIDPLNVGRPRRPTPASQPSTQPSASPQFQATPKQLGEREAWMRFSASVGGVLALGAAPAVAGGITVQPRLHLGAYSIALEGRIDIPASMEIREGELSTSLQTGSLLGCRHVSRYQGCAIVAVGALRSTVQAGTHSDELVRPYAAGGVRLAAEIGLFWFVALRVHADLLATFTSIRLQVAGTERELWTTPPLSGALGLAAVGNFL